MLNKILIASNIVLILAVGFLYLKQYSNSTTTFMPQVGDSTSIEALNPTDIKKSKIVFVNSDSLLEKYEYYKVLIQDLESRKRRIEGQFESQARSLQSQIEAYQQKGKLGNLTAEEIESTEMRLMKQRDEILKNRDEQLGRLMTEEKQMTEKLFDKIYAYVKKYNEQTGYQFVLGYNRGSGILFADNSLDITKDIVEGLNNDYKKNQK